MTAAIYIRKSREDKDKPAHRLTVQREQLPAYAAAQGWKFEIYDDGHASAARGKIENLQERNRLERDIRAGRIDIILTIELSRLSRDDSMQDYVSWLHLCGEHGVKLATMSRTLDPGQHSDWMLLLMEGGFSSVEMKVLQARMKEGREQAFLEGKFLGGFPPPPYIYDKTHGAPVIDPDELEKIQEVWKQAEKKSARAIAIDLGLPPIAVRRSISDDRLLFYQALRQHPQTGEMIQCEWQPCMTAEQADRIKRARRVRKKNYPRPLVGGLLSNMGFFQCGYCGRSIRAWNNNRRQKSGAEAHYYGCTGRETKNACPESRMILRQIIEEKVVTNLINTLSNIESLREYWQKHQQGDTSNERISDLIKQRAQLQAKKQRLAAAVMEEVIDFAEAKKIRKKIETEISEIDNQLTAAKSQQKTEPQWENLSLSREEFEALDQEEQREVLSLAIDNIRFFATYLVIEYKFPRTPTGDATARIHLPLGHPTHNRKSPLNLRKK